MKKGTYFISGIDTNIGKSIATGILARELQLHGYHVITQKMIQTGNKDFSEDIELHRQIMGIPYTHEDLSGITAPCIRSYPCSPHLAAKIDNNPIDTEQILSATRILESNYDIVLLEGAGGLMVPVSDQMLTIDYICKQKYPLILITGGKLGSLNHTLLTLEAIKSRGIPLYCVIYNRYPSIDPIIEEETLVYLKNHLSCHFPDTLFKTIDKIDF